MDLAGTRDLEWCKRVLMCGGAFLGLRSFVVRLRNAENPFLTCKTIGLRWADKAKLLKMNRICSVDVGGRTLRFWNARHGILAGNGNAAEEI